MPSVRLCGTDLVSRRCVSHLRNRGPERREDVVRVRALELRGLREEFRADAAEDLQIRNGLTLWRKRLVNALHASLQVRERPVLLSMNRRGEKNVGGVIQWMRCIPRMNDERLRLAQVGDDSRVFRPLREAGV